MRWMLSILGAAVLCLMVTAAVTAADRAASSAVAPTAPAHPGGNVIDIPGNTLLDPGKDKVVRTAAEWHKILTPDQYYVTREKGTERAFTGQYDHWKGVGTFVCVACGNPLFASDTKFDSGTGWPSFFAPLNPKAVHNESDWTLGMKRTEVECARCGAHLGHVFDDGPKPTGLRYCMNSVALKFIPKK